MVHKYQNAVQVYLGAPLLSSAGSVVLETGKGGLLGSDFPLVGKITKYNTNGVTVLKREIVNITGRSGDIATISRAYETCPLGTASSALQQVAQDFDTNDILEIVVSKKCLDDFNTDIADLQNFRDTTVPATYATKTELANSQLVYGASSAGTDAYAITVANVSAYQNGQRFSFLADVGNTGPATFKVNALSALTIKKNNDQDLATGDIEVGQIVEVVINNTDGVAELVSQVATVVDLSSATPPAIYDTTFPAGEDIIAGNSVFIEPVTPYASATTFGNIGDQNANKRVSFPIFGSGVSGTTLALALKRILATTVDLTVRIETDNAGSPSGTLAHANAVTTIPRAEMLTAPTSSNDDAVTTSSGGADTASAGYRIYTNYTSRLTTVNLSPACTATRVRLFSDAGLLLATATVVANVATFNYILVSGTYYRIEADNNGGSYTMRDGGGAWAPRNKTNINYISASLNQSATAYTGNSWNIHSIDTVGGFNNTVTFPGAFTLTAGARYHINVVSGTYNSENVDATNYYQIGYSTNHTTTRGTKNWDGSAWSAFANAVFPYISSTLCLDNVLSKTSATYSYKIDWLGISSETKTTGNFPKIVIGGIDNNQSGMTLGATQYISNTAGAIAASAGSNSKKIGKAISATQIKIIDIPL